jgi:protocatechuate 3,4-dioxygenase beta subunit
MKSKLTAILLGLLLVLPAAPLAFLATGGSVSNPSVISGSSANLVGPYVNGVTYPIFANDHASLDSLLAGTANILDYKVNNLADLQTAESATNANVTSEYGSSFEDIIFNMYCATGTSAINCPAGNQLAYRQAIAQLFNSSYAQQTVQSGVLALVNQNPYLPASFGLFSTNNIHVYTYSESVANATLAHDPQIAFNPTAHPSNGVGSEYACSASQTGVWQYATSMGSGHANGTDFTPKFYTRSDHADWFLESQQIWHSAAAIGLCFDMKAVSGFGSIFPIVYAAYSNAWSSYFGGASYSAPLNPTSAQYFGYGTAGFVTPFDNTGHFYNSTVQALLNDEFTTSNTTRAEQDAQQVVQILTYQIPTFNLWWDNWAIPSLNNNAGTYWSGYVDTPGFGTWTFSTGFWTLLNLHRINPTTGAAMTGGTAIVNMHEAPDDYNIWFATSVYDFDVINSVLFDTPMVTTPGNPTPAGLVPWMLTTAPTVTTGVNAMSPHGHKVVNGMEIQMSFAKNITWADGVPFTANDYNFSLWYANANGVYGPYSTNTGNYVGVLPSLADSQVTGKYTMTIWLNTTAPSQFLVAMTGIPTVPEHLWSHVSTSAFNGDINPVDSANDVNGVLLETGASAFYWSHFVQGSYISLVRNPGYFKTNIHAWQLPAVQVGSAEPLSFAIAPEGTAIPSSASATVTATQVGGSGSASATLTLGSSGNWTGSLSTTGLAQGFYEVTVNATYTDANGFHTALQFYGLTVQPAVVSLSNLQVTVTNSQGQPISGATVTVGSTSLTTGSNGQVEFTGLTPGTVTVSASATGYVSGSTSVTLVGGETSNAGITLATPSTTQVSTVPTTVISSTTATSISTTSTSAPDYTLYYIAAAVIIVLAIIGAALYSRRGK